MRYLLRLMVVLSAVTFLFGVGRSGRRFHAGAAGYEANAVGPTSQETPTPTPSPTPTPAPSPTPYPPPYTIRVGVGDWDCLVGGVPGVTIKLTELEKGYIATATTDDYGTCEFDNLGVGRYTVTASKVGYTFSSPVYIEIIGLAPSYYAPFGGHMVPTNTVQFQSSSYAANKGAGSAQITVTRSGGPACVGVGPVDYATTSDGTASERSNYIPTAGTLSFGPYEMSKTFAIPIIDNAYVEGNKTVNVSLRGESGTQTGTPSSAVLTIIDDRTTPPTSNPIDNARFFVREHYYDLLNRLPDQNGLDYWTNQITQCNDDQNCIGAQRIDVSNAFFFEQEYQQTGAYVYRLYRAAYGNSQPFPDPDSSNPTEARKLPSYVVFGPDRAIVVGGPDLAGGQLGLALDFVNRPEFRARYPISYPDGMTLAQFVDAVVANIKTDSGADLTSQRDALIDLVNHLGPAGVMYRLADDNAQTNPIDNRAFIDVEYNRSQVFTQYAGYLRRDADINGFLFWLSQVNNAPLRDVSAQHAMVCSFITSVEYQQRFSPIVTHTNADCPQ